MLYIVVLLNAGVLRALEFSSPETASNVVQLYTSEGCSSCPPAERWVSSLVEHPQIFDGIVPLVFHVDYWDWLGWKDPYAQDAFSKRQGRLKQQGFFSGVYTPGILVNNGEFREFFSGVRHWAPNTDKPGRLSVTFEKDVVSASFNSEQTLQLHVAWLGVGIENHVKRGENRGKTLEHDFVVLEHQKSQGAGQWQVSLQPPVDVGQTRSALAVWLTPLGSEQIIQAAAAYYD